MATRNISFYINNGPPLSGTLEISQPAETVWSQGPRPDRNWIYVDQQGHWHAYSEDKDEHYPTLDRVMEHVECDGSCGGTCDREGYHVARYHCSICREEVHPGLIAGPHSIQIPGLRSWSAEVVGRLPLDGPVTVRIEVDGQLYFGVAQCISTEGGRFGPDEAATEFRSKLVGIGPLGKRKAATT